LGDTPAVFPAILAILPSSRQLELCREPQVGIGNAVKVAGRVPPQPLSSAVENAAKAAGGRPKLSRSPVRTVRRCVVPVSLERVLDGRPEVAILRCLHEGI